MKYVEEFRDQKLARGLAQTIAATVDPKREYRLMEFCGGHTHAIFRYGIQHLMPPNLHFIHGPGCPVCVLPINRLEQAIILANQFKVILCTYGDLMRVPAGNRRTLQQAKAAGAAIQMIYSTQDALNIARTHPNQMVVLFAIGFETTTPPTAVAIKIASIEKIKNFLVFCNHVLTPPALRAILTINKSDKSEHGLEKVQIDGILGPSHVSAVIGSRPYSFVAQEFKIPVVIAGFEPLDVMQATLMLVRQINLNNYIVENQYTRVVTPDGNQKAQALMQEVFQVRESFDWRGLGSVPFSAYAIAEKYSQWDAEKVFNLSINNSEAREHKGCECPAILRGLRRPTDCKLFGTVCTPENPQGACMVSAEGACAAYWSYGRTRNR